MISVLVVEDSPSARDLLVFILESDAEVRVIGTAEDGAQAMAFLEREHPDVITMDIHMPRLDGFETTCRIMETGPVPIVMVSASLQPGETQLAFRAIQAGALDAVEKPRGPGHADHQAMADRLLRAVKTMAGVKVIKRWSRTPARAAPGAAQVLAPPSAARPISAPASVAASCKAVVIGASTGGPPVLQTILGALPPSFPVPLLIVQHIAPGFTSGMVDWLRQTTGREVSLGVHGEVIRAGHVYVAPDDHHMGVDAASRLWLRADAPENNLRPAVSVLFRSAASAFGAGCIGVLLTGMGRDGAEELRALKGLGAVTIAQDEASSTVHGMPGEAIRLGGATYVLPPKRIAAMLESLTARRV